MYCEGAVVPDVRRMKKNKIEPPSLGLRISLVLCFPRAFGGLTECRTAAVCVTGKKSGTPLAEIQSSDEIATYFILRQAMGCDPVSPRR